MPTPLRNGNPSPLRHPHHHHPFLSTISERKIRRINALILLFRLASFSFSLASAIFTASNSSHSPSPYSWLDSLSLRFLFAANAIVAVYSLFEIGVSVWEIMKGVTFLPESIQLWFDFTHDQVFAYMVLAAGVAGAGETASLRAGPTCQGEGQSFCVQAVIGVTLGFAGLVFLALATLASGFRLVCFTVTGSRFPFSL